MYMRMCVYVRHLSLVRLTPTDTLLTTAKFLKVYFIFACFFAGFTVQNSCCGKKTVAEKLLE